MGTTLWFFFHFTKGNYFATPDERDVLKERITCSFCMSRFIPLKIDPVKMAEFYAGKGIHSP